MCDCERIDKLLVLKEQYMAERARYELEFELFGGKSKGQLAEDRGLRIAAIEVKLKELKPCTDCEHQRRKAQEELEKKQHAENRRRLIGIEADLSATKDLIGKQNERMLGIEKNLKDVNEILYDPGE